MINAKITDIPVPVTRTEHFMYSAITGSESGMKADTQAEMYLDAIKNGDTSDLEGLEPRTVLDMYLEARQTGVVDDLPKPRTTSEMLLYQAITGEDLGAKPVSNMDKYLSLLEPNNYDARIEIESESSTIKLTDSKNGVVEVKELEGNTLVNEIKFSFKDTVSSPPSVIFTQIRGLKPNTTYTAITPYFDSSTVQMYIGYNGGQGIVAYQNSNVVKFTTNDTIHTNEIWFYYRGTGLSSFVSTLPTTHVILEGDWTNKEIPAEYFEGMKSVGECEDNKIEIISRNKNLFDGELELGSISTSHGGNTTNTRCIRSKNYIKVRPNTTIIQSNDLGYESIIYIYDKDKNLIAHLGSKHSFTIPGNGEYIRFRSSTGKTENNLNVKYQFEEGSVATSYVPYSNNKKEIQLSEPLRGVGDVKDRIVLKDGKLMVERNCGEIVLTGDEQWWLWSANALLDSEYLSFYMSFTNYIENETYSLLSNTLVNEPNTLWHKQLSANSVALNPDVIISLQIAIRKVELETQDVYGFKQWLRNNPTRIVYRLKTPTYEEISPQLSELILTCYDNATLHFNTNIPPKSLISYTANTSNIYRYLDTLKLSKAERDSIINSMERV